MTTKKALKKSFVAIILSGVLAVSGYFGALNALFDLYQNIADKFFQKKRKIIFT